MVNIRKQSKQPKTRLAMFNRKLCRRTNKFICFVDLLLVLFYMFLKLIDTFYEFAVTYDFDFSAGARKRARGGLRG